MNESFVQSVPHTTYRAVEEEEIQPLRLEKDSQGKPLYVPYHQFRKGHSEVSRVLDSAAKQEIAEVLSASIKDSSGSSDLKCVKNEHKDVVSEQEIVPTQLSHDQKKIVLDVLNKWINLEQQKKATIFQNAVSEVIDIQRQSESHTGPGDALNSTDTFRIPSIENMEVSIQPTVAAKNPYRKHLLDSPAVASINDTEQYAIETSGGPVTNAKKYENREESTETLHLELPSGMLQKVSSDAPVECNPISDDVGENFASDSRNDKVTLRPKGNGRAHLSHTSIITFQPETLPPQTTKLSPDISEKTIGSQNAERPKSILFSSRNIATSKLDDVQKSFPRESKLVPALRPLSAMRPLSASLTGLSRISEAAFDRPASGSFPGSGFTSSKTDYPKTRQEDGSPFQVDVLKGITGIGIKVKVTPDGYTQITEIQGGGPVDKIGQVRTGDYLFSVNSSELTGQTDARVQQVLRLLPRGLTKMVIASQVPVSARDVKTQFHDRRFYSVQNFEQSVPGENLRTLSSPTTAVQQASVDSVKPFVSHAKDSVLLAYPEFPHVTSGNSYFSTSPAQCIDHGKLAVREQEASPSKAAINPVPVPRIKHNKAHPKSVSQYLISEDDSNVTSIENSIHKKLQDVSGPYSGEAEKFTAGLKHPSYEVSDNFQNCLHSKHSEEMHMATPVRKSTIIVPTQFKTDFLLSEEKTSARGQSLSQEAPSVSFILSIPPSENLQEKESEIFCPKEKAIEPPQQQVQPTVSSKPRVNLATRSEASTERIEAFLINYRATINPGFLGKSRLGSESSVKSEDSSDKDDVFVTKQEYTKSTDHQRLNSVHREMRPSTVIDKSGRFVSSTAEPFDPKVSNGNAPAERTVTTRRISVSVVTNIDAPKALNKSLTPLQDRYKNKVNSYPSSQPTLSSTLHPRTVSYPSGRSTEIIKTVPSPRNIESAYDKVGVTSPHLNSALSPRRISAVDSPTSPSLNVPAKYPSKIKEEPPGSPLYKQYKNSDHAEAYKYSPVTMTKSSLLPQSSQQHTSSYEHHIKPSTSTLPARFPSMSSVRNDEALESTMRKFDELLMAPPYTRTKTDPNDLLLWVSDVDSGQKSAHSRSFSADDTQTRIPGIRKLITYSRYKRQPNKEEAENAKKDKHLTLPTRNTKGLSKEAVIVETMKQAAEKTFAELLDYVNAVETISSGHREADNVFGSKISGKASKVLTEGSPDLLSVRHKSSDKADKDIMQKGDDAEEFDKLLGSVLSSYKIDEQPQQDKHEIRDDYFLDLSKNVLGERSKSHLDSKTDDQDNMRFIHNLVAENVNNGEVINHGKKQNKSEEALSDFLKEKPHEIIKDVIERISSKADIFFPDEKSSNFIEHASLALSDDESPPLPSVPPPLPSTLPPSFILSEEVINQSPHKSLDQNKSCLSDGISEHLRKKEDSTVLCTVPSQLSEPDARNQEITRKLVVAAGHHSLAEDDQESKGDSVEPLNSTGDSYHDGIRGQSPSPVDMLSEDSGMAADDDQEMATDDAISLSGEMTETESDSMRATHLPSELEAEMFSSLATTQKGVNFTVAKSSRTAEDVSPVLVELMDVADGVRESDTVNNELPPLLLPSFSSPATYELSSPKSVDSALSHPSSSTKQISNFPQLSSDYDVQPMVSSDIISESKEKSADYMNTSKAVERRVSSSRGSQEQMISRAHDTYMHTVISKRKWCLRSNLSRTPVLQGNPGTPVYADYTERNLLKSLPYGDLITLVNKLNAVLDAGSASVKLILTVVHIHLDGNCIPLGIDLKHEGGIWFRVSGIKKDSPVWKEGSASVGDWLVAVDSLWCDQVSVMRFLSRLAKPKHDTLLVFSREEKSVESSVLPAQDKQLAYEDELSVSEEDLHLYSTKQAHSVDVKISHPVKVTRHRSYQEPPFNEQMKPPTDHIPSLSEQRTSRTDKALSLLDQPALVQAPLPSDQSPSHSDQVASLLNALPSSSKESPHQQQEKAKTSPKEPAVPHRRRYVKRVTTDEAESIPVHDDKVQTYSGPNSTRNTTPNSLGAAGEASHIRTAQLQDVSSNTIGSAYELSSGVYKVIIMKSAAGVGFSLEGGLDSSIGDMPITIKRIFKGGPAEKSGFLKVKDEILEVNGFDFSKMRHYEAWNHLKCLSDGEVHIIVRRNQEII